MSDRVRYADSSDLSNPTQSGGFNGFTRVITRVATPLNLKYKISYANLIKHVWRVRKCRWKCSLVRTTGVAPNRIYYTVNYDHTSDDGHTSEIDLITDTPRVIHFFSTTPSVTVNITNENGDPPSTTTDNLSINAALTQEIATGDYYISSIFWFGVYVFASASPSPGYVVVGSVSIFGNSFNLYASPYDSIVITAASFEIAEYWPYAATNNSAIYNTTTGAQLQSPAN